jgi:hypothetical protein
MMCCVHARSHAHTYPSLAHAQIVYYSSVLYVQCESAEKRNEWVDRLREQIKNNGWLHPSYHPGFFDGRQWTCCCVPSRDMRGCARAFDYA